MKIKEFLKQYILPAFIVFTYVCLVLETLKYPGFIGNHFVIDSKIYFTLVVGLVLLIKSKSKLLEFIFRANLFFLPLSLLVYFVLEILEAVHYTNYVLATFHINLTGFTALVLFSLLLTFMGKFRSTFPQKVSGMRFFYPVMILLVIYFVITNGTVSIDMAVNRDFYIFVHSNDSYDQKMYYQWGDFYQYMMFVRDNTPPDATIVTTPLKDPWLIGTGNVHFIRAFLYPRKIVQNKTEMIPDLKSLSPGTYILISWGASECKPEGCHGWPRQDIEAAKILYKDPNSERVIETKENTIYTLKYDKYVYGIIQI